METLKFIFDPSAWLDMIEKFLALFGSALAGIFVAGGLSLLVLVATGVI